MVSYSELEGGVADMPQKDIMKISAEWGIYKMRLLLLFMPVFLFYFAGCSAEKPRVSEPDASSRHETRGLGAASAIGYDGAAMRKSVDRALNTNDARMDEQQKAIDKAEGK